MATCVLVPQTNNSPSLLFDELETVFKDRVTAYKVFRQAKGPDFAAWFGNWEEDVNLRAQGVEDSYLKARISLVRNELGEPLPMYWVHNSTVQNELSKKIQTDYPRRFLFSEKPAKPGDLPYFVRVTKDNPQNTVGIVGGVRYALVTNPNDIKEVTFDGNINVKVPSAFTTKDTYPINYNSTEQRKAKFLTEAFAKAGIKVTVTEDMGITGSGEVRFVSASKAEIKIHPTRLKQDTLYHEFGHILVELLGYDNPLVRKAIESLKGTELWDRVVMAYPEADARTLEMEVLVTALGAKAQVEHEELLNSTKIKIFINRILDALAELFGVTRDPIKELARQLVSGTITPFERLPIGSVYYQKSVQDQIDDLKMQQRMIERYYDTNLKQSRYRLKSNPNVTFTRITAFNQDRYLYPFDAEAVAQQIELVTGVPKEVTLDQWAAKRDTGTVFHYIAELVGNGESKQGVLTKVKSFQTFAHLPATTPEEVKYKQEVLANVKRYGAFMTDQQVEDAYEYLYEFFEELKKDGFTLIVNELTVFPETLGKENVAGTIDLLVVNPTTSEAKILDFKVKTHKLKDPFSTPPKNGPRYLRGVHSDLENHDKSKYNLQLATYQAILASNGFRVDSLELVVIKGTFNESTARFDSFDFPKNTVRLDNQRFEKVLNELGLVSRVPQKSRSTYQRVPDYRVNTSAINDLVKSITDALKVRLEQYNVRGDIYATKDKLMNLIWTMENTPYYDGFVTYIKSLLGVENKRQVVVNGVKAYEWQDLGEIERLEQYLSRAPQQFVLNGTLRTPTYLRGKTYEDQMSFIQSAYNTIAIWEKLVSPVLTANDFANIIGADGTPLFTAKEAQENADKFNQLTSHVKLKIKDLKNKLAIVYEDLTMQKLAEYAGNPEIKGLLSDILPDGTTKSESQKNEDLKKLHQIFFGPQFDSNWLQKVTIAAHHSNIPLLSLFIKRFDFELGRARHEAYEFNRNLTEIIKQVKAEGHSIMQLFETDSMGKRTGRFIQRDDNIEWVTEYLARKKAYLKGLKELTELEKPNKDDFSSDIEFDKAFENYKEKKADIVLNSITPYNKFMWETVELSGAGQQIYDSFTQFEDENGVRRRSLPQYIKYPTWKSAYRLEAYTTNGIQDNPLFGFKIKPKEKLISEYKKYSHKANPKFAQQIPPGSALEQLYEQIEKLTHVSLTYYTLRDETLVNLGYVPAIYQDQTDIDKAIATIRGVPTQVKKLLSKDIMEKLRDLVNPKEEIIPVSVDELGNVINMVPFYYLGNSGIEIDTTKIPNTDDDFVTALYKYAEAAHEHRAKVTLEPEALLTIHHFKQMQLRKGPINRRGVVFVNKKTNQPLYTTGDASNAMSQFSNWFAINFYREMSAKNQDKVAVKVSAALQNYMSYVTLAFNFTSATTDTLGGHLTRLVEATGNRYLKKAYLAGGLRATAEVVFAGEYNNDGMWKPKSKTKLGALLKQYKIVEDTLEKSPNQGGMLKNQKYGRFIGALNKNLLFVAENVGEFLTQGSLLYAMLRSTPVKNSKGEEITLWDAYSLQDGYLVLEKGVTDLKGNPIRTDPNAISNFELAIERRTIALNQKMQGNYRDETRVLAQRYWFGSLLMQFRKYLVPLWVERYGSRGHLLYGSDIFYDEFSEEYDRGRAFAFREMMMELLQKIKGKNDRYVQDILLGKFGKTPEMVELNQRDMRKNWAELGVILSLTMLSVFAHSQFDIEEKRKMSWFGRLLVNMGLRLTDELTAHLSAFYPMVPDNYGRPSYGFIPQANRMLNDPFAAQSVVDRAVKLTSTLIQGAIDPSTLTYRGGPYRGENKLYVQLGRLVPVWNQVIKAEYLEQTSSYYLKHN